MSNLAAALVTVGDYAPARELAQDALEIQSRFNNPQLMLFARSNLAEALQGLGDHAAALATVDTMLDDATLRVARAAQNHYCAIAAEVYAFNRRFDDAARAVDLGRQIYEAYPGGYNEVNYRWAEAVLAHARDPGAGPLPVLARAAAWQLRGRVRKPQAPVRRHERAAHQSRQRQVRPPQVRPRAAPRARRARSRRAPAPRERGAQPPARAPQQRAVAQDARSRGAAVAPRQRGRARPADAALQPPLSRLGRAGAAVGLGAACELAGGRADRPRPLQARQRHARPPRRRQGADVDRAPLLLGAAAVGRDLPLRRRGILHRAARHRRRGRDGRARLARRAPARNERRLG